MLLTQPPKNVGISRNGLALWLDGKDFFNSPVTTKWKDKSNSSSTYNYTNIITNGDLSSGLTGWTLYGTGASNLAISNGYITISSTSGADGVCQPYVSIVGHKYYFAYIAKFSSAGLSGFGLATCGVGATTNTIYVGTTDTTLSGIVQCTVSYSTLVFGRPSVVPNTLYMKNLMVIDLTATFGTGNEPSQVWCDANLPFIVASSSTSAISNDATPVNFAYTLSSGSDGNGGIIADGVDDRFATPAKITTIPFTLEAKIKWSATSNECTLFNQPGDTSRLVISIMKRTNYNVKMQLGNNIMYSNQSITGDIVYHLTLRRKSDGTCSIFINGILDNETILNSVAINTSTDARISLLALSVMANFYKGVTYCMRLYNRDLSNAEIYNNFIHSR
jgi:hypothetical protein